MNIIKGILSLFGVGNGTNTGSVVKDVADIVENYKPGAVTEHKMDMETIKVEDASQDSARKYDAPIMDDPFNRIVNALNRLPRPILAFWSILYLFGVLPVPIALLQAPPIVLNIIWTVIGFYFGIRTISQDLPSLIKTIRGS